jgi:hypothetical protein
MRSAPPPDRREHDPTRRWSRPPPAAVLRLTAGVCEEAIQLAVRAAGDAAAAAGWLPAPTFSADHAFATDSHAARRNAHIDANGLVF